MSGKTPKDPIRILNGILSLGLLFVLAAAAGLAATAVSESSRREKTAIHPIDGSGLRPERIQGKYGYVNEAGKVIIAPTFDGADAFSEGLAMVLCSGRFGYIDSQGVFAIPAIYRHARAFQDGYAPVRFDGTWLTIDRGGKPVVAALEEKP
ncbi:MAG: Leptospira [Fibrobacteres bacterium]|nr:Leptospira [Fibrobacterota bacterium]